MTKISVTATLAPAASTSIIDNICKGLNENNMEACLLCLVAFLESQHLTSLPPQAYQHFRRFTEIPSILGKFKDKYDVLPLVLPLLEELTAQERVSKKNISLLEGLIAEVPSPAVFAKVPSIVAHVAQKNYVLQQDAEKVNEVEKACLEATKSFLIGIYQSHPKLFGEAVESLSHSKENKPAKKFLTALTPGLSASYMEITAQETSLIVGLQHYKAKVRKAKKKKSACFIHPVND